MMSRMRAIKVLDYALSTPAGTSNCERFVDIFGLKTLFSALMRKVKKKNLLFFPIENKNKIKNLIHLVYCDRNFLMNPRWSKYFD